MTQTKTKKALLMSVLSMVLCVAMLVGMTFAWFTDTASTSVNKIVSGKLDVALEMYDKANDKWVSAENTTLNFMKKDANGNLVADADILWEPGATFALPTLRIANNGSLALKYKVEIKGITGNEKLLKVIDFTIKKGDAEAVTLEGWEGKLLPKGADALKTDKNADADIQYSDAFTIAGTMQTTAGNEYQEEKLEGVAITVVATQLDAEYDSNGNTYDENAAYPLKVTQGELNTNLTLDAIPEDTATGKHAPVEVTLGNTEATDIDYFEHNSGYRGTGVMLGSTKLNKYAAEPAEAGEYTFIFKDGTVEEAVTGYSSIDGPTTNSVYMLVPGNSDVVFENMTFNGVVSFDIQKYTSPWSHLNSITFKNCTFNGIVVGTCPASDVTIDNCTFNNYTNAASANNSNPIWWRADYEGQGGNATYIKNFTFVNNKVTSTRPVKIERIGRDGCNPVFTFKNNTFDISAQTGDTVTKNMAINIGQWDNNSKFTLIDEGNTISANTASLYTAALDNGSNQYIAVSGNKVLDGKGNNKTITAMVWKTTTGQTFKMKTID